MLLFKKTSIPLYNIQFVIVATDSWKELNKKFGSSYSEGTPIRAAALHWRLKVSGEHYDCLYLVLNPLISSKVDEITMGTIAHEAVHIKNYIFKLRGVKNNLKNDEPEAYLIGWIVNEAHRFYTSVQEKLKA